MLKNYKQFVQILNESKSDNKSIDKIKKFANVPEIYNWCIEKGGKFSVWLANIIKSKMLEIYTEKELSAFLKGADKDDKFIKSLDTIKNKNSEKIKTVIDWLSNPKRTEKVNLSEYDLEKLYDKITKSESEDISDDDIKHIKCEKILTWAGNFKGFENYFIKELSTILLKNYKDIQSIEHLIKKGNDYLSPDEDKFITMEEYLKSPKNNKGNEYVKIFYCYDDAIKEMLSYNKATFQVIYDWLDSPIRKEKVDLNNLGLQEADKKAMEWHDDLVASGYIIDETGDIIMTFDDGYYWIDLKTSSDKDEANAMGHCGRTTHGETLLSLRIDQQPHVTIAYSYDGTIFQMKGRNNKKPISKYFPYIVQLLCNPNVDEKVVKYSDKEYKITKFSTIEYLPSEDFHLSDLKDEDIMIIYEKNDVICNDLTTKYTVWKNGKITSEQFVEGFSDLGIFDNQIHFLLNGWSDITNITVKGENRKGSDTDIKDIFNFDVYDIGYYDYEFDYDDIKMLPLSTKNNIIDIVKEMNYEIKVNTKHRDTFSVPIHDIYLKDGKIKIDVNIKKLKGTKDLIGVLSSNVNANDVADEYNINVDTKDSNSNKWEKIAKRLSEKQLKKILKDYNILIKFEEIYTLDFIILLKNKSTFLKGYEFIPYNEFDDLHTIIWQAYQDAKCSADNDEIFKSLINTIQSKIGKQVKKDYGDGKIHILPNWEFIKKLDISNYDSVLKIINCSDLENYSNNYDIDENEYTIIFDKKDEYYGDVDYEQLGDIISDRLPELEIPEKYDSEYTNGKKLF